MNRPNPFKEYLRLEPLPPDPPELEVAAADALASPAEPAPGALTLERLGRLLRWGAGVAHTRTLPGGDVYHSTTSAAVT